VSGPLTSPRGRTTDFPLASLATPNVTPVPRSTLWSWATATAAAALFFPKIEGIRNHGRSPWQLLYFFVPLDLEGLILGPLVIAVTFVLFWLVGGWALRNASGRNRPARVGLVCGLLGLVGIVAFWLSVPIILGGLAIMLGLQARRLVAAEGRGGEAVAALVAGTCALAVGAVMWSFIT
jgi:hypothetical protein